MDFTKEKKLRVTYTIDADVIRLLERFCKKNKLSKSRVVEKVLEDFLQKNDKN